ncbi:MAG: serine/threonine protein kinase [Planctomycetes bacterium]|nr:serine/threonine protein kinase [Planctomycetota bacterium]
MLATTCYTRDQLERYMHGRANDELSDAIEVHLESCSQCEDTLCELDQGEDTLIRTLQVKSNAQRSDPPAWVEQMVNAPYKANEQAGEAATDSTTEPPDELGDYELVGVLGRGGMSVVFAARHKHLGREVALKVLLPTTERHTVSRERFIREMKAVGGLDHPAIVRATDAGECNETLYLVMEQVDGVDLNRVSQSEGPLRVADACAIGIEVARGLAHAHDQGIVHRDIKPSNLMLDCRGNVKILDFGLARMQSAACDVSLQTTMGQLLGTLDYMAPEQANGSDVDPRADIYALGATLFKLLTGAPPHGRSADMPIIEFLSRLATNDANRLDEQRDQLPSELIELIATMLDRDPNRRIGRADEVAARLKHLATDSNLSELAANAIGKKTELRANSSDSVKASLADCWSQQVPGEVPPKRQPTPDEVVRPQRIGPIGCIAFASGVLSLLGIAALTIVLTLKSSEGEIRIESELDNVRVEVVDESDRASLIAVEQGAAITTVRVGRYRIRLDSPADGIEVTPQEVIVTKDKVVIAKVRKIRATTPIANAAVPQRDSAIAMEAEIELAETVAAISKAKEQPQPDPEAIKVLEGKLARLRALIRPIPTEPVYRGRTLADWVAQMKFEQEENSRQVAAETVLKLAATQSDEQRTELLLDAGSRLFAWTNSSVEYCVLSALDPDNSGIDNVTWQLKHVERSIAAAKLAIAVQSDNQRLRDYALVLCAGLRNEIQRGEWPTILEAIEGRSTFETGPARALTQVTYAACSPDPALAAEVLANIDTNAASNNVIFSMLYVTSDWKLQLSHSQQLECVATYSTNVSDPADLENVWGGPNGGPFSNIDWNHVDEKIQADVNSAVERLLVAFERQLASVTEDRSDLERQFAAALKSNTLTAIIDRANLTGATKALAVKLLNQRLEQLLQLRATSAEELGAKIDTPSSVAVAIVLLTGAVPESIKNLRIGESGYLAKQLGAARNTLLPPSGEANLTAVTQLLASHGGYSGMLGSGSRVSNLAAWYPFELVATFHESITRIGEETRDLSNSSARLQRSQSRNVLVTTMRSTNPSLRVDSRLMLDFAAASPSATEFVDKVIIAAQITPHLYRHPQFAAKLASFTDNASSREATELGFRLWSSNRDAEEQEAKLSAWLESGDAIHVRMAMNELSSRASQSKRQMERFQGEGAEKFANAIDRIAEIDRVTSDELNFLVYLDDNAPRAAEHAIKYLEFWLNDPEARPQKLNATGLRACVDILLAYPEHATTVRPLVQEILNQGKDTLFELNTLFELDRAALERLLTELPE